MRLLIAALAITFTVAIAASVVATWASVTDAPWEDDPPVAAQPVDRTEEIRCEAALSLRETMIAAGLNPRGQNVAGAEREIERFC